MSDPNPRATVGHNAPPLETADELAKRLQLEYAPLIAEAAALELEYYCLPEVIETDDHSSNAADLALKFKALAKRAESARTETGRPYLEAQRTVNGWFKDLADPMASTVNSIERLIGSYLRAKAERERAERLEQERLQREEARRLEQEAEDKRRAAEESQRQADEAAAKIRAAETPEAREEAFAEMRQAETHAEIQRDQAEEISGSAAQADRRADTQGRAADASIGKLSRVSSAGATSSVTETWGHAIADAEALLKSLGPLGPHISNTEISAALSRAVTVHERAGTVETLAIPGVNIFRDHKTNIRARRT